MAERVAAKLKGGGGKSFFFALGAAHLHGEEGVLRLLEKFTLAQLAAAVEYALDIDVIDADSIRTIIEHRSDQPVELFPLDGRPHLAHVRVEMTDVSSYQALLGEVMP